MPKDSPHMRQSGSDHQYPIIWDTKTVMENLGVSKPTAHKLMDDSGALLKRIPRLKRVLASEFLEYLLGEEEEEGKEGEESD